jgi:uncharacterized protein YoxC
LQEARGPKSLLAYLHKAAWCPGRDCRSDHRNPIKSGISCKPDGVVCTSPVSQSRAVAALISLRNPPHLSREKQTSTARAMQEIQSQVIGIQSATTATVSEIDSIGGTISRISEITTTVAAAIEEQGVATEEISRNVHHAADGTQAVAQNIVDVSSAAGKTGAAAGQVLDSATVLSRQAEHLRQGVTTFVAAVRAA